jgi:hypothetical protein
MLGRPGHGSMLMQTRIQPSAQIRPNLESALADHLPAVASDLIRPMFGVLDRYAFQKTVFNVFFEFLDRASFEQNILKESFVLVMELNALAGIFQELFEFADHRIQ